MGGLALLCLLLMQTGALGFEINLFESKSQTHEMITESAILNVTLQVCRTLALAEGKDFIFPPQPFTVESVAAACLASKSSKSFQRAINLIQKRNRRIDIFYFLTASYHCDNEKFKEARTIITEGLSAVKASNKLENYKAAREKLGGILHTLQDFYSHSNWVEIGNRIPNSNLITSYTSIGNIADVNRATCRNCNGNDCRNNILEDILAEKILTSGYFSLNPFYSKPTGKCSHGGLFDLTSWSEPKGGINKDSLSSNHGHLHQEAARVAIAASSELLEDVRLAAGDKQFLQLMGMSTGRALCFVIDTTGSMGDDIDAVKIVTSSIINSKVGTQDEPSVYILVPFNDPDFGPLIRTTDPNFFKKAINSLTASGGGDLPEMSLSGLQLALTGAPSGSEIFLFTDATAKDIGLKSTVTALIERTKSVVNFMITKVLGFRRRRQSNNGNEQLQSRMTGSDAQVYTDLAEASGGQAIDVTKSRLLTATTIITESTSSSMVTILQAARSSGKSESFTFTVDDSIRNLIVYITGSSVTFTVIGPSGVTQDGASTNGSLITSSQSIGNFQTLRLNTQVGLWHINMMSANSYTLKVVGDSPIDFLFDFLEVSNGPFGGFDVVDNRPRAGVNGSLLMTITGSDSAIVREVTLVESSGTGEVNGSVEAQTGRGFLVHFDRIPSVDFVVLLKGYNRYTSSVPFQRQSSTNIRASAVTITATNSNGVLVPGTPLLVPFTLTTDCTGGIFTIRATNDQGFTLVFPPSLTLETRGSANGTVNITAPPSTTSGTDVTLTIEAVAPGATDTNYVVLHFTVLKTVTDFTPPVCQLLSLQNNCSDNCSLSMWELSVEVTDRAGGTGIDRVSLRQGSGTMNTSLAAGNENVTLVSYNASCCSPDVELVVVDRVGNVGSCFYTIQENVTSTQTVPVNVTTQTVPVNVTTQTVPVNVTTQTVPVKVTTQTLPVNVTTQAVPVNVTNQTLPVNVTTQAVPVNVTNQIVAVTTTINKPQPVVSAATKTVQSFLLFFSSCFSILIPASVFLLK